METWTRRSPRAASRTRRPAASATRREWGWRMRPSGGRSTIAPRPPRARPSRASCGGAGPVRVGLEDEAVGRPVAHRLRDAAREAGPGLLRRERLGAARQEDAEAAPRPPGPGALAVVAGEVGVGGVGAGFEERAPGA